MPRCGSAPIRETVTELSLEFCWKCGILSGGILPEGGERVGARDYDRLSTLGAELGRLLMYSGAEIYRVEESVNRLLSAYGLEPQVFAIPNCLIVSLTTPQGHPVTRMCRIPAHGTDIELLERCNQLCRRLCQSPPAVEEAQALVDALP